MLLFHHFFLSFFFFFYCVGVTWALLRCCDLCFVYFSTLCLKIVVHVDNLLLQTLLDFFLTCVIFLAEARLSLSFVSINLNLSYQTKKLSLWYNHCFKKNAHFLLLDILFFSSFQWMLARACVPLTVLFIFYSLFLKSIFLYLLWKNFNLFTLIFQHPKFSLISVDFSAL